MVRIPRTNGVPARGGFGLPHNMGGIALPANHAVVAASIQTQPSASTPADQTASPAPSRFVLKSTLPNGYGRAAVRVTSSPNEKGEFTTMILHYNRPVRSTPDNGALASSSTTAQRRSTTVSEQDNSLRPASMKTTPATRINPETVSPTVQKKPKGRKPSYGLMPGKTPFPEFPGPLPEQCYEVHRLLTSLHGDASRPTSMPTPSLEVAGCGEVPLVLDGLMRTMMSAATGMERANQSLKRVVTAYGVIGEGIGKGGVNWADAREKPIEILTEALKAGGLGSSKAKNMMQTLNMVYNENQPEGLSLEHLQELDTDSVMLELVKFPGVGIKTAACVALFCMGRPCFAVDTHVLRLSGWLGWIPERTGVDNAYHHLNVRVPDNIKYDLHQLFIRHGQDCVRCKAGTDERSIGWATGVCPLEALLTRTKPARRKSAAQIANPDADEPGPDASEENTVKTDELLAEGSAICEEDTADTTEGHAPVAGGGGKRKLAIDNGSGETTEEEAPRTKKSKHAKSSVDQDPMDVEMVVKKGPVTRSRKKAGNNSKKV